MYRQLYFLLVLFFNLKCILTSSCGIVEDLTSENYTKFKNSDVCFILYQSPECTYCKHFQPEYKAAFEAIKTNESLSNIDFYQVDCHESPSICDKESITAYPTVKLFFDGTPKEILNTQVIEKNDLILIAFKYGYTSKEITCIKDYDRFFNTKEVIIFGYFEKVTGLQTAFLRASALMKNYKFGHTSKKKLLTTFGYFNNVVLYQPKHLHNKFEDTSRVYLGPGDVRDLIKFINENRYGLVGYRTRTNLDDFPLPQIVAYYNIDYERSLKLTNYWRHRILKIASKFRDLTFAMSSKSDFSKDLYHLGINVTEFDNTSPLIFATNTAGVKYMMDVKFSIDNLEDFVQNFLNNSLKPYVKSDPIPDENDDVVKIIVGKNFEDVVGKEKDSLIEFYTPWCLICLEFAKTLEDVALEFGNDEVLIGKIDVSANDFPARFIIKSYPTIYFVPKNTTGIGFLYNGSLNFNDLIAFVAYHSSYELKRFDREGNKKIREEL
nr:protein disulfide-isomerase A3-like [Onthophagus taurus]